MFHAAILATLFLRILVALAPTTMDLTEMPELVTPLSSMHRVREGINLARSGMSPYVGDECHQPPLTLAVLWFFFDEKGCAPQLNGWPLHLLFFLADLSVAIMLRSLVSRKLFHDDHQKFQRSEPLPNVYYVPSFLRNKNNLSDLCATVYLLHPFALGSSAAWDTSSLVRVLTMASIYFASHSATSLSSFFLACAGYVEIHPLLYVGATAAIEKKEREQTVQEMVQEKKKKTLKNKIVGKRRDDRVSYCVVLGHQCGWLIVWSVVLQVLSAFSLQRINETGRPSNVNETTTTMHTTILSSHQGMLHAYRSTYMWHLTANDNMPNVGIYWYFFSMLFVRFRSYFTFVFNVQLFVYVAPLVVRLRGRPYILLTILISLVALLRPYPTLGDFSLPMVLMTMHPYVVARMRGKSVLLVVLSIGVVLLPTFGYLWLYPGAACANHYYFSQATYTLSCLLLVSEFLGGALLRDRQVEKKKKDSMIELTAGKKEGKEEQQQVSETSMLTMEGKAVAALE